ncbi:MAG: glycosyltransferase family 2 protein [Methanobacterium sp.]
MKNNPRVSIIIPTLNSEKTLKKCLESIVNQSYPNYEIIIVDGGSEDKTCEIAEKFSANVINVNIRSMSRQTNIGIINSKGDYVYRVDSDVILDHKTLEKCIEKCEIEGYDGICMHWIPDESISFWAKIRKIEKESYVKYLNYVGTTKYNKNVNGARFLRKEVLESVGRFEDDIPTFGEDYALYNKLGKSEFQFGTINKSFYERHIGEPKSIIDVIRKNFNYGRAMKLYLSQEGKTNGIMQFSLFGRKHLDNAFKYTLKNEKYLFLGLIVYIFTVYASNVIGLSYSLINRSETLI